LLVQELSFGGFSADMKFITRGLAAVNPVVHPAHSRATPAVWQSGFHCCPDIIEA
jgi:hypothetical protein